MSTIISELIYESCLGHIYATILLILEELVYIYIYIYIYILIPLFIFGCAGSSLLCELSLVGVSGGCSSDGAQASHCGGFSSQSMGSRAQVPFLQHTGLVALRHVGSS